jgi:Uma2 family endonuclease
MVSISSINPFGPEPVSFERYLELEQQVEGKLELFQGKVKVMPGGTAIHNELCANIIFAIKKALNNSEEVFKLYSSDMRIHIPEFEAFVYPDAVVVCKKPEFAFDRKDIITNPLLVVEVLSPSTEHYDRELKFVKYASIPSFKEYLLVHSNKRKITSFFQEEEGKWSNENYSDAGAGVPLYSIGTHILLDDVYDDVDIG